MHMGDLSLAEEYAYGAQINNLTQLYAPPVAWKGMLSLAEIQAAKHATSLP
jgi:hypothetical protein